jgi:DNA-binding response OmpR family regulator
VENRETQQLLQGENPETRHAADARRWIAIYSALLAFNEELLDRLHRDVGGDAGQRGLDVDDRIAEWELTRLRDRLSLWQRRHRELAGVDIDETAGVLYGADGPISLTTREAQLLTFLLQRPDRYFAPGALAAQAWNDPRLAPEQVRSYVVRLRRLLAEARVACRIDSRRGLGYKLTFEESLDREA